MPESEPARRGRPRTWPVWAWSAASAVALGVAFSFTFAGPFVLLVPALLILAARASVGRRARVLLLAVWCTHVPVWLVLDAFLIDVAVAGWPFLAALMAAYPAAFAVIIRWMSRRPATARLPLALVAACAWTGLEALRGIVLFDGYPWYLIAHPLIEYPRLVQSAAIGGVYFTGSLAAAVSAGVVDLADWRRGTRPGRGPMIGAALAALIAIAAPISGHLAVRAADAAQRPGPRVLILQTNLPQDIKLGWPVEDQFADYARWQSMTLEAWRENAEADGRPIDAILWPETMLPGFGFDRDTMIAVAATPGARLNEFAGATRALAQVTGATVLTGGVHVEGFRLETGADDRPRPMTDRETNVVYGVPPRERDAVERYEKMVLTPFGETMPWISRFPWLERSLMAVAAQGMRFNLAAGEQPTRLRIDQAGEAEAGAPDPGPWFVAAPICYEATVPWHVHRLVWADGARRADLLVNLSNDGWFGDWSGGRRRHAQMIRFRAIEHRMPVVRSVNTGASLVIDSAGRIRERLGDGHYGTVRTAGVIVADVPLDGRTSVYGRVGPGWPWLALAGLVVLLIIAWRSPPVDPVAATP